MVSQKPKYCKNFERNSHLRKLSMIMVWERYCNASPKSEFFLFSLFIFSFISQLIWVRLGRNFHRWFSIQKQVNWCTIDPFSLKFCTSQHSYPVPLIGMLGLIWMCMHLWMNFIKMTTDIQEKLKIVKNLCTKSMERCPVVISHILAEFHPERATYATLHNHFS